MERSTLAGAGARFWLRVMAGLLALLPVGACASDPPRPAPPAGWEVIERLGHARFQPAGASDWLHVPSTGTVPGGSRVITGKGGRLILALPQRQIVAGTAAEFQLADNSDTGRLWQTVGQVRYRVLESSSVPLTVETPFAQVEAASAVLDVSVAAQRAEIRVEGGDARVVTPDRLAGTTLQAGQSAVAERQGREYLLVRQGRDGSREAVAPILVAGATAKQRTPEAKLLAEAARPGEPMRAAAPAPSPEPSPPAAAGLSAPARPAPEAAPAPAPPLLILAAAETLAPAIPPSPPKPLDPPEQRGPTEIGESTGGAAERGEPSASERWAELPSKRTNVVIVPATYRNPPSGNGQGAGPGAPADSSADGERRPDAHRTGASPAGPLPTGAHSRDPRQIPFDELSTGLLDGLPAANVGPRLRPAAASAPARRL